MNRHGLFDVQIRIFAEVVPVRKICKDMYLFYLYRDYNLHYSLLFLDVNITNETCLKRYKDFVRKNKILIFLL